MVYSAMIAHHIELTGTYVRPTAKQVAEKLWDS
jgi:hypothetical protein